MTEYVTLNNTNLFTTYGLILAKKKISAPARKRVIIDVPGREGELDLTEQIYSSTPIYKNRTIELNFICPEDMDDDKGAEKISALFTAFHEKNVNIIFSDDSGYRYAGTCRISSCGYANKKMEVSMEFNCEPYKYNVTDATQKVL